MNANQKRAWFNLGVSLLFLITFFALLFLKGFPWPYAAFLWALLFVVHFFAFRGPNTYDERDALIIRKSKRIAFGVFWVLLVGSSMVFWTFHRNGTITVQADIVPSMISFGTIVIVCAESVATLLLYQIPLKSGRE
ncbi:MAG: hypothetical protein A2487_14560 [Candidatus Raymondbacteria bacterium RifOxyC12_full_50_8]|uniref:Uncharacterized protein n=1 Tax=Candidatus Raymondbacteria bacterium RIFOXYD12_FULL_49_13 TaxID=1817890 RepID=A0A1F7F6I0_UNCRA|nr:MAG: hypothetical protein A2248_03515 [Candidatus Raymondbacteria bacterium RIFOXYA2_FULL_49_16]OGJ99646.1 MAG: hypothetical protein A2350_16170 [Candidatus Raymondbacteria bacterium RifOxyB12_full_50_8]OGK02137.1 MAG: hypothetical protein A2519_18930 [Candidatus Raymondbacteria bacterium RIFOXYD12_FULL_49_13]OGK06864.1 MAG: hypothetical protein A2487_14560 [Candidatus Raymondbacteria bacterium RifOxyC12_full_50_8]OGP42522.1 MAG: hypothetical protein A2324_17550 [Candidatus Raymondbacteria b